MKGVDVVGFKRDKDAEKTPEKALGLECFKEGGESCGLLKG